jgi:hypothetical protein
MPWILQLVIQIELPNKQTKTQTKFIHKLAVAVDRRPCRDLLRTLPWDKSFRLAEKKRAATVPNQHGRSTVARVVSILRVNSLLGV